MKKIIILLLIGLFYGCASSKTEDFNTLQGMYKKCWHIAHYKFVCKNQKDLYFIIDTGECNQFTESCESIKIKELK